MSPEPLDGAAPRKASRLLALDWFRFLAVALMVQGHTFYEVLVREVKDAPWYMWHGYVHGFTAPMFYFSSGLAFGLTTARGWNEHLRWGPVLRKRYERYLILLLIGYGMQAGDFSLRTLLHASRAEQMPLLAVNTLQNIGATLFLAELLVVICRKPAVYRAVLTGLAAVIVLAAPWAWRLDLHAVPTFFAAYVSDATGSLFPIFPWSAYTLAGILVSLGLVGLDGRSMRAHPARFLLLLGAVLAVVGKLGGLSGFAPWGEHNYWKTSPWFFLQRLGVIVLVFSALAYVERHFRPSPDRRGLRFVQTVAQETLVIYVGHLFLLYGTPWTVAGLHGLFPETLSLGTSILAFVFVLLPMLAIAYQWHHVKTRHGVVFDRVRWTVTAVLIVVYVLNPGAHP